jgi:serine/threonine protein kinase
VTGGPQSRARRAGHEFFGRMIALTCSRCRHGWNLPSAVTGFAVLCPACGMPVDLPAAPTRAGAADDNPTLAQTQGEEGYESLLAPPEAPDELGRLGGYRVLQLLGQGGMGFVFRAEDPRLRREVALKVMRPENLRNTVARQRFLREARAAAAVEHENVLSVLQVGEEYGVPFLAMPLLAGETLQELLARDGTLAVPEVIRVGSEAAAGLAAAHAAGLVHRDVKPANLWLEAPAGRVKVFDFGLARRHDRSDLITSAGRVVGSPAYMAPEQAAAGDDLDTRADLFSLGCVLYQAATGRRAFDGPDVMAVLSALANHDPPPACEVNFDVPPALSDLIARMMEKDPARRPASAHAVAEALRALGPEA